MVTLIHGTDQYLSYKFMKEKLNEFVSKGFIPIIINVDDENEVPDQTSIIAKLTERDMFGSKSIFVLKRISSSDLFYKQGKALKSSEKFLDLIKNSLEEIILWEDKNITTANQLHKISKEIKSFNAPFKEYEVSNYINQNYRDLNADIKKLLSNGIKTTDTYEINTEIQKLISTPKNYLNLQNLVLSSNIQIWILSDALLSYVAHANNESLKKLFDTIDSIDEELRYKLAVIQNSLSEMLYVKRIIQTKDNKLQEQIFNPKRAFVYQKLERALANISGVQIFNLYTKSLIVEYLLNKGQIIEDIALKYIFVGDIKLMSSELIDL